MFYINQTLQPRNQLLPVSQSQPETEMVLRISSSASTLNFSRKEDELERQIRSAKKRWRGEQLNTIGELKQKLQVSYKKNNSKMQATNLLSLFKVKTINIFQEKVNYM